MENKPQNISFFEQVRQTLLEILLVKKEEQKQSK